MRMPAGSNDGAVKRWSACGQTLEDDNEGVIACEQSPGVCSMTASWKQCPAAGRGGGVMLEVNGHRGDGQRSGDADGSPGLKK